jgi:hypothetical protein
VRISCVQVKKAAFRPSFWIRTSQTCVRRPTWSGRPIAVSTSPTRPAAKTFAFSLAVVDLEAALHLVVLDPDHFDAEVAGEAALDAGAEAVGGDLVVGQAAFSRSAPPS